MKIGVISDVHNNLLALKTIIEKFKIEKVDKILCAGDLLGLGPNPNEVINYVMNLDNFHCVLGNHDRYLTEGLPNTFPNEEKMDEEEYEHHKWEHNLLTEESKKYLNNLPLFKEIIIGKYKILLIHYFLDDNQKYINIMKDYLEFNVKDKEYDIIIFGHDHRRIIQKAKNTLLINPGSLGCPSKEKNITRGLILDIYEDIFIEEINCDYDVNKVIDEMDKLNYPSKDTIKKYFYGL